MIEMQSQCISYVTFRSARTHLHGCEIGSAFGLVAGKELVEEEGGSKEQQ
jgi:hypothetical protein